MKLIIAKCCQSYSMISHVENIIIFCQEFVSYNPHVLIVLPLHWKSHAPERGYAPVEAEDVDRHDVVLGRHDEGASAEDERDVRQGVERAAIEGVLGDLRAAAFEGALHSFHATQGLGAEADVDAVGVVKGHHHHGGSCVSNDLTAS